VKKGTETGMSEDPPFLSFRYGQKQDEEGEVGDEGKARPPALEVMNYVFLVLTWVILVVVLVVWALVGAIFWIPLLIRAMLRFCLSLIEAMFEGHKPTTAARILRDAVSFYKRGFTVAIEVVTGEEIEDSKEGRVKENRLLLEVLWALLVWYFIFLLFGWVQASPLDLLDWFLAIPWADHLRDLWNSLTGGRM
jgi:hypothetical protein